MTEQQYAQALENRRVRGAAPALDSTLAADLIGRAAASQRRFLAAEAAWERLVSPAWRERAAVESVESGTLTIAVADWTLCMQLRASRLGRDLTRAAPGVSSVRFVVRGSENQNPTEQHE